MHLLISLLAMIVLTAPAEKPDAGAVRSYFCSAKGTELRCERYDPEGNKHWWTQTISIKDVRTVKGGVKEIDFVTTVISDKQKSPIKGPMCSTAIIQTDGTVDVNISDAAATIARQTFSALNFVVKGGVSSLSPALKPGDTLADIHSTVEWSGIKLNLDYWDRKVLRRETITVPAGTFECIVVEEHKLEKFPFHRRERITHTWYALDYGMIRHDTYFLDGRMECSEQLYAITK